VLYANSQTQGFPFILYYRPWLFTCGYLFLIVSNVDWAMSGSSFAAWGQVSLIAIVCLSLNDADRKKYSMTSISSVVA
jgi:hypothetical protein